MVFIPQEEGRAVLQDLIQDFVNGEAVSQLELYCNREFSGLQISLNYMTQIIDVVLGALERTLKLAQCDTIVPIYKSIVYDGTCSYSLSAVMWVFSGFLIASFFGLVMITLRSSYKQTIYLLSDDNDSLLLTPETPGELEVREVNSDVSPRKEVVEDYGLGEGPSRSPGY